MTSDLLRVETISKQFQRQKAVDALSFTLKQGEIFALLGPNGAGKTTAIRMLLGILNPDSGTITLELGPSGDSISAKAKMGYLPEDRGLYRDIPVLKTLTYMGILRGLSRRDASARSKRWLDLVGLADRANDKLETLSKGNQQKVQFISAILHEPKFAVLDEPFSGLDPLNQDALSAIIRDLRKQGMTVLLCAHQMGLIEQLADRMLLMNRGREVLCGTLDQLRREAGSSASVALKVTPTTDIAHLGNSPLVQTMTERGPGEFTFLLKSNGASQEFLREAVSTVGFLDISIAKTSLHDIFVEAVRKSSGTASGEGQ